MANKKQGIISFGPKEFSQGISPLQLQQSGYGGFFATAPGVEIFRYPGFISPGPAPVSVTNVDKLTGDLAGGSAVDTNGNLYLIGDQLYQVNDTTLTYNYLGAFPHAYTGNTALHTNDTVIYAISGTSYLFYFHDNDIGRYDLSSTFVDNWGSTVPTNAANITTLKPHKAIVFNGISYFLNGNMVASIDGTSSPGILNLTSSSPNTLVLPPNYTAIDIRINNGNLEVYANTGSNDGKGQASIFVWDGVAPLPSDIIDIDDNYVGSSIALQGFPHLFTSGRQNGFAIRKQSYFGYEAVQTLQGHTTPPYPEMVDTLNGMVAFTSHDANGSVFTYGTPFQTYSYRMLQNNGQFPDALFQPFKISTNSQLGLIKSYFNKLFVGYSDVNTGTKYLQYFDITDYSSWNNSNASFQTIFTQLPNDASIDYVRFYVLPPASGAAFTPKFYTDFGTSPVSTLDDITSATLDANGKSKTYYADQLKPGLCDNFAIGGNWANSADTTNTIVITRIDVGYSVPA